MAGLRKPLERIPQQEATRGRSFEHDASSLRRRPAFYTMFTEQQQAGFLRREPEYLAAHPDEIRTIRTRHGTFDVNLRRMMDLAEVVSAGGFTIA
jgi:hypothetical protein